ncbi:MAG: nucleotidyltransferase [Deltaproteobacteria bacterium]|nr:nucleotidyltransferase [Deltaproteobacteria bacterium]
MPALIILAAGIGSRYGGLKQIDPVGPHRQIILDYSIYDAVHAGFDKIVFVIRKEIEVEFKQIIGSRYEGRLPCEYVYVYQELDSLPPGFSAPAERKKPWGTGHAVLVSRSAADRPFVVINADDFYGRSAYEEMARFLAGDNAESDIPHYAMVGYRLKDTLSESGPVARGVCWIGPDRNLISVTERTKIEKTSEGIQYQDEDETWHPLTGEEIVSMSIWAFTPAFFGQIEGLLQDFLKKNLNNPTAEFFLPGAVDHLIQNRGATVTVLESRDQWVGVTNPDDKPQVTAHLKNLVKTGIYPEKLWP